MDVIGSRNLRWVIEHKAGTYDDKEFIVFEDNQGNVRRYSYKQVNELVNKFANILINTGVKKGDKVVVHLHNSPEYVICWFAIAKIGAVMVCTNILYPAYEMEYCVSFSDSVVIITEPEYMPMINSIRSNCPKIKNILLWRTSPYYRNKELFPNTILISDLLEDTSSKLPEVKIDPEDELIMLFTSGTTARPKGCLLTHANAVYAGIFGSQWWKITDKDRNLSFMPYFHVNGQFISIMPTLTAGATLIILERFSATRYMEQARRHCATIATLVGATCLMLLNQPATALDAKNDIRIVPYAIAIPEEKWDEFEKRFDVKLCDLWGMTETLGATTINPLDGVLKRNCIGLPRLGIDVMIANDEGKEVPVRTIGEILVKGIPGRTLFKGYYKNSEATEEIFRGGWLHSGDNGCMDEDGYFHFVDRKKDMIHVGGENVAASEVEDVIVHYPKVNECAVISTPDPIREEAVKTLVVLKEGESATEEEIINFCKERLAKFKVPKFVEFRESLPKASVGNKIQKAKLREEEWEKWEKARTS